MYRPPNWSLPLGSPPVSQAPPLPWNDTLNPSRNAPSLACNSSGLPTACCQQHQASAPHRECAASHLISRPCSSPPSSTDQVQLHTPLTTPSHLGILTHYSILHPYSGNSSTHLIQLPGPLHEILLYVNLG